MADYTWQRHLIAHGAYADWVDRGRTRPTHRQWSWYLREGAEMEQAEIIAADVVGLEADGERWQVMIEPGEAIEADGVRRMLVLPATLAERLAARAEQRGLSVSDLLVEYAQDGLDHDGADGA